MNLIENILLAISGLRTSKMRSLLTMLGIIIGIGSVIAIVTIGNAMTAAVTGQMSAFGLNNVQIYLSTKDNVSYNSITDDDMFALEEIETFMERFAGKLSVFTLSQGGGSGVIQEGRRYANTRITGVSEGYEISEDFELLKGRFISRRDVLGTKPVAIISDKAAGKIFGSENPLGKEIKVYHNSGEIITFSIIGVYEYEPSMFEFSMASEEDLTTQMYIPVSTAQKITGSSRYYDNFSVTVAEGGDPNALIREIEEYFTKEYARNPRVEVYAFSMGSMVEEVTTMLATLSIAIAVIAGISLLVGGIGVMNIMLVSVTERTREIGTRKALGARNSAIRIQFIVESMIICLIGGIIGIGVGLLMGYVGATALQFTAIPSVPIIIIAVLFSMGIGIFFGYYPANKAAKLDPIEALRYE